uniref:hypothetical protein n=1 Tax=Prevotella sp. TaxID=59823 RepID=UPI004028E50B
MRIVKSWIARKTFVRDQTWGKLHLNLVLQFHVELADKNYSMIGKNPPKGMSFSDFICIFAMSFGGFCHTCFCSTKVGIKSDMAKFRAALCCSGTYKNANSLCCRN